MFKIMKKTKTQNKMNPQKREDQVFFKNKINQRKIPLNLQQYFNWKKRSIFLWFVSIKGSFIYIYLSF